MTGRQLYDKLFLRFRRFLRPKPGDVSPASPSRRYGKENDARSSNNTATRKEREQSARGGSRRDGGVGGKGEGRWVDLADDADVRGGDGDVGGDWPGPYMGSGEDKDCPKSVRLTSVWVAAEKMNRWGFRCVCVYFARGTYAV